MIKKKNCCEGRMLAALAAGALLAVVAGFAMGWVWDKRNGALSDVSILSVLTALGTTGAAFGAAFSAFFIAKQSHETQKQKDRVLKIYFNEVINNWDLYINNFYYHVRAAIEGVRDGDLTKIKNSLDSMSIVYYKYDLNGIIKLNNRKMEMASPRLYQKYVDFHNLINSFESWANKRKKIIDFSAKDYCEIKTESLKEILIFFDGIVLAINDLKASAVDSKVSSSAFGEEYAKFFDVAHDEFMFPIGIDELVKKNGTN